jgi:hypothetical protein
MRRIFPSKRFWALLGLASIWSGIAPSSCFAGLFHRTTYYSKTTTKTVTHGTPPAALPAPSYAPVAPAYMPMMPAYAPVAPAYVPASTPYNPVAPSYAPVMTSYVPMAPSYAPMYAAPVAPSYAAPAAPAYAPPAAPSKQN